MQLDLRFNGLLHQSFLPLLDEIASNSRKEYNEIITSSSALLKNDLDWWSESVSSRNTYASPLFHYICSIKIFRKLIEDNPSIIDEVYVDSKELVIIFERIKNKTCTKNIKIIYRKSFTQSIKDSLSSLYFEFFFLTRAIRLVIARLLSKKNQGLLGKSLILIDTFITTNYIEEDRWYGCLWENLSLDQKKETYFVPTFVDSGLINFYKVLVGINSSERNTILKEDFLKFRNIFHAYLHKFRVKKLFISKSELYGMDLTGLVTECLLSNRDVHSTMESLLTYSFLENLSLHQVKVRLSIDWFEGHCVDKLWNLGIYKFFPLTKRFAYETFRSFPYYLSTFPIPIEREARVVPETFLVQGPACIEGLKEFIPELDVISVPALKNQHVWNFEEHVSDPKNIVLVAFPISIDMSVKMLEALIDYSNLGKSPIASYILKPHPVNMSKDIESKLKTDLPSSFSFTKEASFPRLLTTCSILVTEASSVCLEALAVGKPVIILENTSGLTYDPVPKDIPKEMFRKCSSQQDIHYSLNNFLNLSAEDNLKFVDLGKRIRSDYFEPFSISGLNKFLDIKQ